MKISSATSVGKVRPVNEDAFFVSPPDESGSLLAIVADGMGGHNAGEVASSEAINVIKDVVLDHEHNAKEMLIEAINSANSTVYNMSLDKQSLFGMGTTITACVIDKDKVTAAQVGDSRLYLIRDGMIIQITKDHSLVEMLIENGSITKEDAKHHPQKNVITRAIGTDKEVSADIYEFSICAGDILLLCSDGLVNMVEDEKILSVITRSKKFEETADKLIDAAETAGGSDNITVILIKF
ncbi:MAG: Stp1/IreP family PP2C-type Ser/Thr phosphatase [Clostridia bacterium]|nr:Stp1/IreP family PP2C-type Ser/Thr phosphatase [Clostridia bacterium]